MKTALRRVVPFSCVLTMALCAGCDDRCPVMEIRHEVVSVTMSSENSYQFSKCVDSGDCQQLCVETAMARSPYASAVDECSRVDSDGGVDGGSNAGMLQVTLAITYRVFEFCGA